jgi:hypothetical protein
MSPNLKVKNKTKTITKCLKLSKTKHKIIIFKSTAGTERLSWNYMPKKRLFFRTKFKTLYMSQQNNSSVRHTVCQPGLTRGSVSHTI